MTKEFRKMSDSEKLNTVKDVIKAYQDEIDSLTKRAKASEKAFSELYKDLNQAPDPAKALTKALASRPKAAQSNLELQKLRQEISAYEKEFKMLKNQDVTIRQLEETIDEYEEQMETKVAEMVEAQKAECDEEAAKRIEEVLEREAALERRLAAADSAIVDSKVSSSCSVPWGE